MIEFPLLHGKIGIIDDCDSDLLHIKWFAHRTGRSDQTRWYVDRMTMRKNVRRVILLHRVIVERMIGRPLNKGEQVDHINHDCLDNRRSNLRIATPSENMCNQQTQKSKKTSRFKGVHRKKNDNKWTAQIRLKGEKIPLGRFISQIDAARAYDDAAKKYFGEYANPNFPI